MILSLKEPDFFLDSDWMLPLRFSDPNFRRSKTLPRLGESSPVGDEGVGDIGFGVGETGVIGGRVG